MKKRYISFLVSLLFALMATQAWSLNFSNDPNDPSLASATYYGFDSDVMGFFSSKDFGDFEINVLAATNSGRLGIDDTYSGAFGTSGRYLENKYGHVTSFDVIFHNPVSAYGFSAGAVNVDWNFSYYDVGGNLLGNTATNNYSTQYYTASIVSGENPISRVVFTAPSDWVLFDHFRYTPANNTAPVPEPSTILLMGCGLAGLVGRKLKLRK